MSLTYAGYNFPLKSVQKKPFTPLAMGLGGKFWVMTKVLELILIRAAWVCEQKFKSFHHYRMLWQYVSVSEFQDQ